MFALTPSAVIFLPFDEKDGVASSDRLGNLEDLGIDVGNTKAPALVDGWAGYARLFDPVEVTGVFAGDTPDGDTLLNRNVTVQAILSVNIAAAAGDPMTLVCRGLDGSTSERYAFGLELQEQAGAPGYVEVRWFWQTAAGVLKTQLPGVFRAIGAGDFFLLTATRRWESSTRVVCRYYVGDRMIAEVASVDGDVGGGTTGHTSIGARKTAGAWGRHLAGAIDELLVTNYEMCGEEIEATWSRLRVHQPDGVARFRALSPPGAPWARPAPDSRIGKIVKVVGQALGLGAAKADELLRNWLPDRTYLDLIGRWETLLGIAPKAFEALDVRRARVVAFLRRDNGYSLPKVKIALEELFNLETSDIEILEFSPTVVDAFATLEAERWHEETAAQWSSAGNALRLQVAAAADILTDATHWTPCHLRMAISDGAQIGGNGEVVQQAKVASLASIPADLSVVGLFFYNVVTHNALWFGLAKPGADHLVAYRSFKAGVLGARVTLANLGPVFAPIFLRLTASPTVAGTYTFEWGTTSFVAGMTASTVANLMADPQYVGFAALGDDASLAGGLDLTFDDFLCRMPRGDRAYFWYAYRNLALAGAEDVDLIGANLVLRKLRPGHTHAAAITSKSLLCDDTSSLCDTGPMGGI